MRTNQQPQPEDFKSQELRHNLSIEDKGKLSIKLYSNTIQNSPTNNHKNAKPQSQLKKIQTNHKQQNHRHTDSQTQKKLLSRLKKYDQIISQPKQSTSDLIQANGFQNNKIIKQTQRDIPFFINPQALISFNTHLNTKVYLCRLKDDFLQETLINKLTYLTKYAPDIDHSVKDDLPITSLTFQKVLNSQFKKAFHQEQTTQLSASNLSIPHLKCQIINIDAIQNFVSPEFIQNYLATLRRFYQYKHYFMNKALFSSQQTQKRNQRLKLMYFKLNYKNQIKDQLLSKFIKSLESQKMIQKLIYSKSNQSTKKQQTSPEGILLKIKQKIQHQSSYHKKENAFKIFELCLQINKAIITPMILIELFIMLLLSCDEQIKGRAYYLIKIALVSKPQLILNDYPGFVTNEDSYIKIFSEFNKPCSKNIKIKTTEDLNKNTSSLNPTSSFKKPSKPFDSSASIQQQKINQVYQNEVPQSENQHQEPIFNKKIQKVESQKDKQKTQSNDQPQNSSQSLEQNLKQADKYNPTFPKEKSLKEKYEKKTTILTCMLDILMQTDLQVQIKIKELFLSILSQNQKFISCAILKQLVLYQMFVLKAQGKHQQSENTDKDTKLPQNKQFAESQSHQYNIWLDLLKNLFKKSPFTLTQQILSLIENGILDDKSFQSVQKAFEPFEVIQKNIKESRKSIGQPNQSNQSLGQKDSMNSGQDKQNTRKKEVLNEAELNKLFAVYSIQDFFYAKTKNQFLNSKLLAYAEGSKNLSSQNQIDLQTVEKQSISQSQKFLYVISQHNPGKTVRQLIQNNWNGLQNHSIKLKLIQKFFYAQLLIDYQGFNLHVSTLDNVIVNMDLKHPDLNVNMSQFIPSSFLFTPFKQTFWNSASQINQKNPPVFLQQTIRDFLPFVYQYKPKKRFYPDNLKNSTYKINPIKQILTISLFIICRRLDFFQSFETIINKLKVLVKQKNEIQKKTIEDTIDIALDLLSGQRQKQNKENKQTFQKHHFLSLSSLVPELYDGYLKKMELKEKPKKYELISYENSNYYRIQQFEKFIEGKQQGSRHLFDAFKNQLAAKTNQSQPITWRKLYQLFFMLNTKIISGKTQDSVFGRKSTLIKKSKLLVCLCELFDYPIDDQKIGNKLPPELFFALRYDIHFCYFAQKFQTGWFNCFEINQETIEYDMEVMCLLKNIKLELMEKICDMVPQLRIDQSQQANGQIPASHAIDEKKMKIHKKIMSGIELLKYLRTYEKRVHVQVARKKELQRSKYLKSVKLTNEAEKAGTQSTQKLCEFYPEEYKSIINEEDLNNLQNWLQLLEEQGSPKEQN